MEGISITVKNSFEIISEDEDVTEAVGTVSNEHNTENDGIFTGNPTYPIEGESKITNSNIKKSHDENKTFVSNSNIKLENENKRGHKDLTEQNNNLGLTENELNSMDSSSIPMPKRKKAKQCRFFKQGFCKKGINCDFSHGKNAIHQVNNVSMKFPTYEELYEQNQALITMAHNLEIQVRNEREMKESLKDHLFKRCKFSERVDEKEKSGVERASPTLGNDVERAPLVLTGTERASSTLCNDGNRVEKRRKVILESQVTYGSITKKGRVFTEEEYEQHLVHGDIKRRDAKVKRQRRRILKQ